MLRTQFALPTPVSPVGQPAQRWPSPPPISDRTIVQYLPTPPDTPLEPLPVPSSMLSLPNEIMDKIFSFAPSSALPTIMLANTRFHALAERLLYFKVQHLQLFSPEDGHCNMDWRCLRTIASRSSAAAAVRHFAVKSLPWLNEDEIRLLASALSGMVNLSSMDLNLGPQAEHSLLSYTPTISTDLCALNVLDAKTALLICTDPSRPISALRVHYESPFDPAAANELLCALQKSPGPLRTLQIALSCHTGSQFISVLRSIAKCLPHLNTLGIHIRSRDTLNGEKDWVRPHQAR